MDKHMHIEARSETKVKCAEEGEAQHERNQKKRHKPIAQPEDPN